MIFRQLYDITSGTFTYVLGDEESKEAIIVDPVLEQIARDMDLVETRLGLTVKYVVDTHVHADHVTSAFEIIKHRPNAIMVQPEKSGVEIDAKYGHQLQTVDHESKLHFGSRFLRIVHTPGHTDHHVCFILDDESLVLTGDSLLVGKCARTDFQGGSAEELFDSIHGILYKLPDSCFVYPGHDYVGLLCSTIGEEKRFNSRIPVTQSSDEFVKIMSNLGLPKPKLIDVAVPANLKGGVVQQQQPSV